jgi:threonine dehydrogenase-like Zn-dependent dehydrogenase
MRSPAVVLREFGADLEVEQFDVPEPAEGAMVVEVGIGGICGTDSHLQEGHLPMPTPVVLGHEGVGRVARLGDGVEVDSLGQPLQEGDPVTWMSSIPCGRCFFCVHEREPTLCTDRAIYGINRRADEWPHLSGSWAGHQYLQPGTTVVRLADDLDPLDVIALGCAGPTVVHGLRQAPIRYGSNVVVQGSGPVGIAAAIHARAAGAGAVIMIGGPAARLDVARDMNVANTYLDIFKLTNPADRVAAVSALTPRSRGADLVIECTGVPSAVEEGIDLCRGAGTLLVLGQYTDAGPTSMNPHLITRKQLKVLGSWAFSGTDFLDYMTSIPRLRERFDLRRLVTTYKLGEANQALADVRAGSVLKAALAAGAEGEAAEPDVAVVPGA